MKMQTGNLIVVFFTLVHLLHCSFSDLSQDREALLRLRSSVGGKIHLWNVTASSPCKWNGVSCENNRVTVLRLPGKSLAGELPTGIFSNLTELRTLSLRLNALTGKLPSDLASCKSLRNLYLQGNKFSGEIPEFLPFLHDLVRLNLASNNFSGQIPASFSNLTRLRTLYLENNQLSGSIPVGLNLPDLSQFNVSNNLLKGSIPAKLQSFHDTSFLGNSLLCGKPLVACSGAISIPAKPIVVEGDNNSMNKKKKKLSGGAIAGIAIGSVLGLVLIVLVLLFLCRKKSTKKTSSIDIAAISKEVEMPGEKSVGEVQTGGYSAISAAAAAAMSGSNNGKGVETIGASEKKLIFFGNQAKVFDLEDLLRASAEVLGKGTFGTAYKAVLEMGTVVAVKRLRDVNISENEFREKIEAVGTMDHENLVPLRAYYYSRDEKLLVHDYMPMGSLSALLHGNKGAGRTPLNWDLRWSIALGAARGVDYLHSQGPNVSHGNIKSSNVLLSKSYEARVSDFGLVHLVGPSSAPNRVAGYRAPEVTD
ncbi:probable inactive receptor kinase At1g48480, partial [Rutidosis leptorrhynchoides]|uniref:probable inactive receptor kinase At1g48480 n=1 Tax=Rutidosis leptorrhynchoides TaxID=125765 RepID=UPI003A99E710